MITARYRSVSAGSWRAPPVRPEISHAGAGIVIISPARCTVARIMQNQARSEPHADSNKRHRAPPGAKEGTFFPVSSLQAIQVPGLADSGRQGCIGAEAGSEQEYGPPTAVLCCCTRPESWAHSFDFVPLTSGSMGIRAPDLLHAISRRPIHRSTSVQVTVPQRALQSAQVRVSCGTFVLYSPPIRKRPQTLRTPVVPPVTPAAGPVFVLALRRLCPGLEALR